MHAEDQMPRDDAAAPWWARAPARLAFLLAVLAGVAAYGVPRIIANASAGTSPPGTSARPCSPVVPSLAKATIPEIERTADYYAGLYALLGRGRLDVWGLQEPSAAWADNPPGSVSLPHLVLVDAGFEMRWWSPAGDHLGASLFAFPDSRSAEEYVSEASSSRCRMAAVSGAVSQPSGARALVWENPEGYLQADVYFARGSVVYRLAAVGSGPQGERPTRADAPQLLRVADGLACALTHAGCTSPGVVLDRS